MGSNPILSEVGVKTRIQIGSYSQMVKTLELHSNSTGSIPVKIISNAIWCNRITHKTHALILYDQIVLLLNRNLGANDEGPKGEILRGGKL